MQIAISIRGDKETMRKLNKLGSSLYHMKGAMETIGKDLAVYYAGRAWSQRGRAFNNPWPDVTPARQRIKNELYRGRGTLEATGEMKDNFTYAADDMQVVVGNNSDQFKYHQSTKPRKVMPRRQMIGKNSQVERIVRNAIRADIHEKLKKG